jgi:hypothetical protein
MFYTVFLAIFWFCSLILAAVAIPIGTVERNWRISYAGIYQFASVVFLTASMTNHKNSDPAVVFCAVGFVAFIGTEKAPQSLKNAAMALLFTSQILLLLSPF